MPLHTCPICKREFEFISIEESPNFPFCSERCRLIDLGKWLDEEYIIPEEGEDEYSEEEEDEEL